ncbi:MAG: thioredoxin domain-containing protein, partial [bacterium]
MRITSRGGLLLLYALVMVGLPTSRAGGAGRAAATLSQAEVSQPLADQVKVLSDQIIALQKMIASQQGAILDLQQNLKKMQDDLTALKRAQAAAKPAPPALKLTAIAGNPILGDAKAPVTIIEFSDFQCPYCGRWFHDTLPQLKKDYIDT